MIKLRSESDPAFKVDFHVDFSQLEYIANDLALVKEYDFELVVFQFEPNQFFTTRALYHKLQETNRLVDSCKRKQEKEMGLPILTFLSMYSKFMLSVYKIE